MIPPTLWMILSIYFLVLFPAAAMLSYLQRKIAGDYQARMGPNRTGLAGFFQPIADLLKLLGKRSTRVATGAEFVWHLALSMSLFFTLPLIPLGSLILLVDTDISALLPLLIVPFFSFSLVMYAKEQRSIFAWTSAIRWCFQNCGGLVMALFSLLTLVLKTGTLRWTEIVAAQSGLQWNLFESPFLCVAGLLHFTAGAILFSVSPFHGPRGDQDLLGGVTVHLSGRALAWIDFGRFYGFFFWSVTTVALFFGGWNLPGHALDSSQGETPWMLAQFLQVAWVCVKASALILLLHWFACSNPRLRVDQTTRLVWRYFIPLSLINLAGFVIWLFLLGAK